MTVYTAYHGSNRAFDKPSDFSKLKNLDFGPGFYFALDPHDASSYGSYLYKAEVRVDRPIVISPDEIDQNFVRRFAKALGADDDDIRIGTEGGAHPIEALFELARTLVQVETLSPISLRKFLIKLGYDGVLVDPRVPSGAMQRHGASTRLRGGYVVAFSPEQILSWERSAPMRQNPPPPAPWGGRHLMSWIQRTYAVGTPVRYGWNEPVSWSNEIIPAGARGVVTGHHFDLDALDNLNSAMILVEITDARRPDGSVINELIGRATKVDGAHFHNTSQDLLHWLPPLVDNWATSPAPLKRHSLPFSQKRTSRKLRPNTIPPPPGDPNDFDAWFLRTYAVGTPVRVKLWLRTSVWECENGSSVTSSNPKMDLVSGQTATVVDIESDGGFPPRRLVIEWDDAALGRCRGAPVLDAQAVKYLEPLRDNWGPLVAPPLKRSSLPFSQKRTSRKLRPNTIPPPPDTSSSTSFCDWLRKTFAKGTRVRFLHKSWGEPQDGHDRGRSVPSGSVGTVVAVDPRCKEVVVEVWLDDMLFTSSTRRRYAVFVNERDIRKYNWGDDDEGAYGKDIGWDAIEPLDDNWGPLVISPKRHSPPPTRGWQKQLSASRSLRASRVKPNRRTSRKRTSRRTR